MEAEALKFSKFFANYHGTHTNNSKLKKEKTLPATQYIEHHVYYQRFSCTHSFEELNKNTNHI